MELTYVSYKQQASLDTLFDPALLSHRLSLALYLGPHIILSGDPGPDGMSLLGCFFVFNFFDVAVKEHQIKVILLTPCDPNHFSGFDSGIILQEDDFVTGESSRTLPIATLEKFNNF